MEMLNVSNNENVIQKAIVLILGSYVILQFFKSKSIYKQLGCLTNWIGDGYCDDTNNMVECNFDGGDCCGPNVITVYCTQCQCLTGDDGLKKLAEIIDYKK